MALLIATSPPPAPAQGANPARAARRKNGAGWGIERRFRD
jgi:hypothetical protein